MTRTLAALLLLASPLCALDLPKADATFTDPDAALVKLGQLLFYDPILSGNREVACATCHHPRHGTGDGLSLGIGDGGKGLGPDRVVDAANTPEQRIPRNAPALFNLGASEFTVMFHDGRLEADATKPGGIRTPLGQEMVAGFASVLSAQSMFPVLSGDEMAGHYSENEVSQAVRQGFITGENGAWTRISARVAQFPEYRDGFAALYGSPLSFTQISDALAAFMEVEWRADDSLFDRHLRGEATLPEPAATGMALFYGDAGCASCHSGQFQTDHDFHAIAMPQIGPGKAARFERHARDEGRMRVTGRSEDAYAFRTPSLRNVWETAPYGHAGAYASLEAAIRHHLDPVASLMAYDPAQAVLPDLDGAQDLRVVTDPEETARIAAANQLAPTPLTDDEVGAIMAFLATLSDPTGLDGRLGIPESVPSGLQVAR